jgi:flavin-dependent dehydrogenase
MTIVGRAARNTTAGSRRVAIIGGGPGGAHCARCLAEAGFAVTLFEPRTAFEKSCGGGIPARGFERYPFLLDPTLPVRRVGACDLIAPSGRETRIPLRDPFYVLSRADLHTFLLTRATEAGTTLVRRRVSCFERRGAGDSSGAQGAWILRAAGLSERQDSAEGGDHFGPFDFLVAADGAAGSARRRLTRAIRAPELTQGLGHYLPGLSEDRVTLKFYDGLNGYLWVFPRPDHSSAGICATLGSRPASALKDLMDRFLLERYGPEILGCSERYAALIPAAPAEAAGQEVDGDGWALVGDSGRFVDPITREGIYFAMRTGEILAGCLAAGDPGSYAAACERECGRELAWAARHAERFFDPRFIERLVALCDLSPAMAGVMSDLIAGKQSYRTLKSRLLRSLPRVVRDLAGRSAQERSWQLKH